MKTENDASGFAYLLGNYASRKLLSVPEVASIIGRQRDYVQDLIEEGKLEAFTPEGRAVARRMVTTRSVLSLLLKQANVQPSDFATVVHHLVATLDAKQLDVLAAFIRGLRGHCQN